GGGHFDVEHYLRVGVPAGGVGRALDRHVEQVRRRQAPRGEGGRDVGRLVPAAEFDDADRGAAGQAGREGVRLAQRGRVPRQAGGAGAADRRAAQAGAGHRSASLRVAGLYRGEVALQPGVLLLHPGVPLQALAVLGALLLQPVVDGLQVGLQRRDPLALPDDHRHEHVGRLLLLAGPLVEEPAGEGQPLAGGEGERDGREVGEGGIQRHRGGSRVGGSGSGGPGRASRGGAGQPPTGPSGATWWTPPAASKSLVVAGSSPRWTPKVGTPSTGTPWAAGRNVSYPGGR